jgi:hypothetical protein
MSCLCESYNEYFFITKESITSIPLVLLSNENTIDEVFGIHPFSQLQKKDIQIPNIHETLEDGYLLYFTQENVAHSICQFIYNYYYIIKKDSNPKIYVNNSILNMPLILNLVKLFFTNIIILKDNIVYKCKNIYISYFIWFWGSYFDGSDRKYPLVDIENNVRLFLTNIQSQTFNNIPFIYFNEIIDTIYETNKHKYNTYDNISIMKTNLNTDSTTPEKCININDNVLQILKNNNYFLFIPHLITDVIEYIVLLRSAKNIITSYGGANCINRFFYTNAIVKVICNKHYYEEYNIIGHNEVSTYKSEKTYYFLDISNNITENEIITVINY